MMNRFLWAAVAVGALVACAPGGDLPATVEDLDFDVAASDLARDRAPQVDASKLAELVAGQRGFATALYRAAAPEVGNLVISPYSIAQAFSMLYAGTRGDAEEQLRVALGFLSRHDEHHPAFNRLDLDLEVAAGDDVRLATSNAFWAQEGYAFVPEFLDTLALHYGAGIHLVDFRGDAGFAADQINAWVSEQTENAIPTIVSPNQLSSDTRFVLANAVYFLAAWRFPFDHRLTADRTFSLLDGTEIDVSTMWHERQFPVFEAADYTATRLPYRGDAFDMVLLVPDRGAFGAVEGRLSVGLLDEVSAGLAGSGLRQAISMPRFRFAAEFDLARLLGSLGLSCLVRCADLSGLDASGELTVSFAMHRADINVDETGTEAAAATVIGGFTSAPPRLYVDRPFLFLIRHIDTGVPLFLGRVVDPRD